jgi:hypothetical protein
VQEAYLRTADKLGSFRGESSPKTWLFAIAREKKHQMIAVDDVGFSADIEGNRKSFSRVRPTTLKEWLMGEHWDRWNKKGSV